MASDLELRAATADEEDWCADLMARSYPWLTYRFSIEWCRNVLKWPGSSLFVAMGEEPLGFLLFHSKGFLGNPYIAAICVAPQHRNRGIGSQLLSFAEGRFVASRLVYLCVSSFNAKASALYVRHGYSKIAELPDFIADGFCEVLMRKRLADGT